MQAVASLFPQTISETPIASRGQSRPLRKKNTTSSDQGTQSAASATDNLSKAPIEEHRGQSQPLITKHIRFHNSSELCTLRAEPTPHHHTTTQKLRLRHTAGGADPLSKKGKKSIAKTRIATRMDAHQRRRGDRSRALGRDCSQRQGRGKGSPESNLSETLSSSSRIVVWVLLMVRSISSNERFEGGGPVDAEPRGLEAPLPEPLYSSMSGLMYCNSSSPSSECTVTGTNKASAQGKFACDAE